MTVKEQVFKEFENLPIEDQRHILRIIRFLKSELFPNEKKNPQRRDAMQEVDKIAVETEITDFADQHDHYLYSIPKK